MNTAQARKLGYELSKGGYIGGYDDNIDGWYIDKIGSGILDRRGRGYRTRKEALAALERIVTAAAMYRILN